MAQAACREGVTVLYKRTTRLFDGLELAHGDGRFPRVFKALTKTQLLILDDWGSDRLNASQRRDLMEIVEDRYGNGSTLITSQLPISTWHDVIGEPTFDDAIGLPGQLSVTFNTQGAQISKMAGCSIGVNLHGGILHFLRLVAGSQPKPRRGANNISRHREDRNRHLC